MYKFIICIDYETAQEGNAFIAHLQTKNLGWWHRMTGSWMIASATPLTSLQLRDSVLIYFPNRKTLVIDMQTKGWCGWGVPSEFDWFDTSWK